MGRVSWTNLGSGANSPVFALTCDTNGNLYAGGWFTTAGDSNIDYIAKWDGASWTNLGSGVDNGVLALTFDMNGNLYAGGWFDAAGDSNANFIATWNGSSWTNLGSGMNGCVEALACDINGNLYAGGDFNTAGNVAANYIAKWGIPPPSSDFYWTNLGSGMDDVVSTLVFDTNANLYAGGSFTNAGGVGANYIAKWDGSSWTNLGSGMNSCVSSLVFDANGYLYAGGDFTNAGGVAANRIAKWDGSSWTNLGSGMDWTVSALACDTNGNLYAGGGFTWAGGSNINYIAKWDGSSWANLGSGLDNPVSTLAYDTNGNIYAGGPCTFIAKWDGASWTTNLSRGMNSYVLALTCDTNGNLYAGGGFTWAGGSNINYIAKWNGSSWTNLGSGMDYVVNALALDAEGNLYAGGGFTSAGGMAANHIAKWNGSSWTNLGCGMDAGVNALACDMNGNLYAGGNFNYAGYVTANYIAEWYYTRGIKIVPSTLSYNSTNPPAQVFMVSNDYDSAIDFTNTIGYSQPGSGWFTASVSTGRLAAATGIMITGSVNIASLNAGTYTATDTISSPTAPNSPQHLVITLTVGKSNQTALVFNPTSPQKYNTTNNLSVSGGSGTGAVSYGVTSGPGQIVGGSRLLITAGAGTVTVVATKASDNNYNSISATGYVTAAKADQAITFPSIPDQAGTNTVILSATALSGLPVTFIVGSGLAQISGGSNLSFTGTGMVGIVASQSGDANYNAAPDVINTFRVIPVPIYLSTPTGVSASDGEFADKVRLTWYPVASATAYEVWRHTANNVNGASLIAEVTGEYNTVYEDMSADPDVLFFYWIRAKCVTLYYGLSEFSNSEIGYKAPTRSTLDVPNNVSASDGTYTNKVRVTYNAVTGAGMYEIWRSTVNLLNTASELGETTNTFYDDMNVIQNTAYYYWVRAMNPIAISGFSLPDSGYASPVNATGSADLSVLDFLWLPTVMSSGDHPGAASVQLINYGPASLVTPNTRVAFDFYLSSNTNYGDRDDVWMGDYSCDQTLGASTYTTVVVPSSGRSGITVPAGLAGGTYYVFVRVRHAAPSTLIDPDLSNNYVMRIGAIAITGKSMGYHLFNDYDYDGKSDIALYKESAGDWLVLLSGSGYLPVSFTLGGEEFYPVLADYDGDGKSDPAVCKYSTGEWQVMLSGNGYQPAYMAFGGSGCVPVPMDYDGDGKADPAVYRQDAGTWEIMCSAHNYALRTVSLGGHDWTAVPADYDGDGITDMAVYRESTGDWAAMFSSLGYWTIEFNFGGQGRVAVPADYDGDGKADPAVYKEASGTWSVMMSRFNYLTASANFGGQGWVPVPGVDYDGDGKADIAIYNDDQHLLKVLLSSISYTPVTVEVGGPGYEPVGSPR